MTSQNGPGVQSARLPLIRATPLNSDDDAGIDLQRLIPAWIISGVVHVVILSLLLLVSFGSAASEVSRELIVVGDVGEDGQKDWNFKDEDPGDGSGLPIQYPVERIEETSMPGVANFNETVGLLNGRPDVVPQNVPPPPGTGFGSGAAPLDPDQSGKGNWIGTPGGYLQGVKHAPGGVDGRSGATREKLLHAGGGNSDSEAAVARGLKWLVRHQSLDGHWGMHDFHVHGKCNCSGPGGHSHDVAGTAFGLLPLLGAGETHKGTGKNNLYAKPVERALKWLITRQAADGAFSGNGYEHAIASIALCEAYGLTADPLLKGPAQRAINCCVAWQHAAGGFRYQPRVPGDLSVSGWFVQALKSGYLAGLSVPNATWASVNEFLDSVSNPEGSGYGYMQPTPAPTTTAVGLLCRQYMGWGPRNVGLLKGSEYLRKLPPSPNFKNIYYYYYATQVMYHMAPVNPDGWQQWNARMRDQLIAAQDMGLNPDRRDQKGSWSPEGDCWGGRLGRLGYTSLALLTLEVYYRYLPLYRREIGAMKDAPVREGL
jgi:hypothetical protein